MCDLISTDVASRAAAQAGLIGYAPEMRVKSSSKPVDSDCLSSAWFTLVDPQNPSTVLQLCMWGDRVDAHTLAHYSAALLSNRCNRG